MILVFIYNNGNDKKRGDSMAFKKILVPVDFSEFSDGAAEYAVFLAQKFCAEIVLVHAIVLFQEDIDDQENLEAFERIIEIKERARAKKLGSCKKDFDDKVDNVDSVLLRGVSAADTILDYLEKHSDIDLVVMGTHGRTGFSKFLTGSVTERVVRYSGVPVITVHKDHPAESIKNILVPIDFSDHSKTASDKAASIANAVSASLTFVHVVEMNAHPEFYNISSKSIMEENPNLIRHIIDNMIKVTEISEDDAQYVVLEGKVHKEITEYAQDQFVDLIVMPTRGMSDLEHLILGSNTERVVRTAECPVLTIRK